MKTRSSIRALISAFLAVVASLGLPLFGSAAPAEALLSVAHPNVRAIIAVQEKVTKDLMAIDGVLGTAVGLDARGKPTLLVFVNEDAQHGLELAGAIPRRMGGVNVVVELTEPFRAPIRVRPTDGGPQHRVKQTPPIQLGTSGGWRHDLANGYCCGGTLGSLVQIGSIKYILSNYHVLEGDIVPGGNGIVAAAGDPVIQPGLIDVLCDEGGAQNVATLAGIKSLPNSNVDAAIAPVIPGMVREDGSILDIGTISASTVGASLNQKVKKSGRTTGLTRSTIKGLNATVSVIYENECAGGTAFTKTFKGQILIKNRLRGGSFIAGGDSGSLMVEDVSTNPRAVGLLFAGSATTAVANPIGQVLSFFGATMVGQ